MSVQGSGTQVAAEVPWELWLHPSAGVAKQAALSSAPGAYFHLESQGGKFVLCGLMYLLGCCESKIVCWDKWNKVTPR